MKKVFLMLLGAMMCSALMAQGLQEGESALVYYSPQTTIILDFQYSIEKQEKGLYAEYAEELLGIKNAIEADQNVYRLENVTFHTRTNADLTRAHIVPADANVPVQWLSINEKGLLKGFNLPMQTQPAPRKHEQKDKPVVTTPEALPLMEDILEAKTLADEAGLVAKHIFRLRETRMYLLSGEVEHAPADGTAMKLVLEELSKQEAQLTLLFTGKTTRSVAHKNIEICPKGDAVVTNELLYFSAENGFTSAENIDAELIRIHSTYTHQQLQAPAEEPAPKKGKKISEPSPIVYNLPGYASIEVLYRNDKLGARTLPVAQFGVDVPLSKDLFTGKELPVIVLNEKTGNIESISK